jgi:hypothetical protein
MPLQCRQVGNRRPLTELVSFTDEGERVIARLRGPAGQDETCEANYIRSSRHSVDKLPLN